MKNKIARLSRGVVLLAVLAASVAAKGEITIKGRIVDSKTGEALPATVTDASGKVGVNADIGGNFRLRLPQRGYPAQVRVRFIGYEPQDVKVGADSAITVRLEERVAKTNEVVIVAYGTQRRSQLTGSVAEVDNRLLESAATPTVESALGGAVAGVSVTSNDQPGGSGSIRIRGGNSINASNDPLYVIDGVIYFKEPGSLSTGGKGVAVQGGLSPLAMLNPSDIESFEVLKDVSSTAIYGSRGANGVILITTKKGKRGQNTVKYDYSLGWSRVSKTLDLMNAQQWAAYQKEYFYNKGGYTDEQIAQLGRGTDWQKAVLQTGRVENHRVSFSGGDDRTRYLLSANLANQDGIILNTGYKRTGLRLNIDREISKSFSVGATSNISRSKQRGLTTATSQAYNSSPFQGGITSSFVYALLMPPVVPIYTADGEYNYTNPYEYAYFKSGSRAANPVSDLRNSVAETVSDEVLGNIYGQYKVGTDLTAKASFGFNTENLTQNFFAPSYTALGLAVGGQGSVAKRTLTIWQTEYTLNYRHTFARRHYLDLLGGYTYQNSDRTSLLTFNSNFTNESLKQDNLGDGTTFTPPQTDHTESDLHSALFRANYTLDDRYNLTATFRADHSSRFAASHRWGYFPSLGLAWNVEREAFLSPAKWIDALKLRLSVGTVGNQEISDYAFATSYTASVTGGQTSYTKSNNVNSDLKWETTASYNVGLDWMVLDGRVGLILDAYYKKTSDLLLDVPIDATSAGVTHQIQNVGNVVNRGYEVSLSYKAIRQRDLQLTLSLNTAYNHNEITSLGANDELQNESFTILRKGEAVGSFFGLIFDGIVQQGDDISLLPTQNGAHPTAGMEKFRDVNGDGKVDLKDRVVLGHVQPSQTYGFSASLKWKRWDAFLQLQAATGGKVYNSLRRTLEHPTDCYNVSARVLNSWTLERPSQTVPAVSDVRQYSYADSRYVENADFLKLKTLSVGYTLPLKSIKASVRVFGSVGNLLTLTGYKGYDPEVAGGYDTGNYPSARTFTIGAGISF